MTSHPRPRQYDGDPPFIKSGDAPAISVVLPTHNRSRTLLRAIRSVLDQSFRDFELVVVDDASTDGTEALVRALADPRLRYLRLPENRGPAGARNAGIAAARADWLAFQDSDDEWLPAKLERQWSVARAADPRVGLILSGYRKGAAPEAPEVRAVQILSGAGPRADLLDGSAFITPAWLARRHVLDELRGFDESYPCLEDWDLVFRLAQRCEIRAVPEALFIKHSSGSASVCADPARVAGALDRILHAHGDQWREHPRRHARRLSHLGYLQYALGNRREARRCFARALARDPANPAPLAFLAASFAGNGGMTLLRRVWPRYTSLGS